jgi:hypothetical protein
LGEPSHLAKRSIHRRGVREGRSDIGIENDDVGTLSEAAGVLAADTTAEVVLGPYFVGLRDPVRLLLHRFCVLHAWPPER